MRASWLAALAAGWMWAGAAGAAESPPDRFPRAGRSYLVTLDGADLWARAPDAPRPPASLTKIMTALLAFEAEAPPGTWVRVSRRAAAATGSRIGLRAGEELSYEDVLTATLVASANDACLALAEHLAGSEAAFVERMNARARALGLSATHFRNACGHDAEGHVSSARDLLRLTRAALAVPALRRTVALARAEAKTRGGRTFALRTSNVLLGRVDGVQGVKSGYTQGAGRCIVTLARRGGKEVLLVLLDSPDRWWTAAALLEAAFDEARARG